MFKSCIANVGSMMKHTVYFTMFLLSSIIGIFFMYLGATGSWDATTILMSMMGVMGICGVYFYLVVYIHPWCRETLIEAKRCGLICTGPANRPMVPTWADGDPRFDANACLDDNEEPITDFSNVSYEDELRAEIRAMVESRENSKSGTEYRYHTACIHMLQRKLDEYLEKSWD